MKIPMTLIAVPLLPLPLLQQLPNPLFATTIIIQPNNTMDPKVNFIQPLASETQAEGIPFSEVAHDLEMWLGRDGEDWFYFAVSWIMMSE